ncbi:MAG: YihY/virulence factor BrkB family protein [Lachnospiraceae bacterium]|nr:YihY/virulence factor BrkB family protein [Lachnospiraceae bacterium]
MINKIIRKLINLFTGMSKSNVPSFAASVAFYFFISMFPILMFICALIPYLPFTEPEFVKTVNEYLPVYIQGIATSLINQIYRITSGFLPLTAIITLWTAGMGIMSLIRGLNAVYKVDDNRNYFLIRILGSIYTLLFIAIVGILVVLGAFGKMILLSLSLRLPHLTDFFSWLIHFRAVIVWALLTIILDLAYAFLPGKRQKIFYQLPGSMLASLAWCLTTWGFSIYIEKFNGFSMYGGLMGIMIFLFWLNIGFNLVMFGAYFNMKLKPYLKDDSGQNLKIKEVRKRILNLTDDVDNDAK